MEMDQRDRTIGVEAMAVDESAVEAGSSEETLVDDRSNNDCCQGKESVETTDRCVVDEMKSEVALSCEEAATDPAVGGDTSEETLERKNDQGSVVDCPEKRTTETSETHHPQDNLVTIEENISGDTVASSDAASVANDCTVNVGVVDETSSISLLVERNCCSEQDSKNTEDETQNHREESAATRSSSEAKVDHAGNAQSAPEKGNVDQSMPTIAAIMADESQHKVVKEAVIEQETECIEFSLVEYPEESITEPASASTETIEVIVQSSDKAVSEVLIVKPKEITTNETDDKLVIHSTESSTTISEPESRILSSNKDSVEKIENSSEGVSIKEESADRPTKPTEASPKASVDEKKAEDIVCEKVGSSESPSVKQRSVIEDIFDDWRDENPEDECQTPSKPQDSVEMELKILLDDEKPADRQNNLEKTNRSANQEPPRVDSPSGERSDPADSNRDLADVNARPAVGEASQRESTDFPDEEREKRKESAPAKETSIPGLHRAGKTIETPVVRDRIIRQKPLAPRPGVKVPGFLLTSPIVSKTAVSKVLKERLREQQKDYDSPGKPDIFFVKKITQRLSHKLAAASAAQVPGLVPLPQIGAKVDASRASKALAASEEKIGGNVDKELLAILEGDVDPDWSNLKPPTLVSEPKSSPALVGHNTDNSSPPKLDPLIERELALKQLLELPSSPIKKIVVKKGSAKTSKASKAVTVPKTLTSRTGAKRDPAVDNSSTTVHVLQDERIENADSSRTGPLVQESKVDETRSGRKRKPTEKAREHEQNTTRRVKVFRAKTSVNVESRIADSSLINKNEVISASGTESSEEESPAIDAPSETAGAQAEISDDSRVGSSSRRVETKKAMPKPSAKRKLPVGQKYARQKMPANKKPAISLKPKFPKKSTAKVISHKRQKQRNGEPSAGESKPKKKVINEIDRLLQDEGVVNLLYDVEQPGKKRLVPITKSQTKVMDLQKIQRELKIRTKLVRNAVLRLRTSNINTSKVSPRSKRSISHNNDARTEKKTSDQAKSGQTVTSPTDFIFPAKIRNAADASIIIRRHSSSSFSSASASPRASIDTPERLSLEGGKVQEGFSAAHLLRSNKRRRSQEETEEEKPGVVETSGLDDETMEEVDVEEEKKKAKKKKKQPPHSPEAKRNRKRAAERPEVDADAETGMAVDEIGSSKSKAAPLAGSTASFSPAAPSTPTTSVGRSKKVDAKKNSKSGKQQQQLQVEVIDIDENSCSSGGNNAGKIATRSNGPMGGGKIMGKIKKTVKCKVSFAKESEPVTKADGHDQEDELSVCLAEAVTALSNDSGGPSRSRSTIPVNRNRTKGSFSCLWFSLHRCKQYCRVSFA